MLHRQLAPRAPRREGPERYAQFVAQGRDVKLWEAALSGQIYLGDEEFIQRMQAYATLPDDVDYLVYSAGLLCSHCSGTLSILIATLQ
jgi:hypothetical protein